MTLWPTLARARSMLISGDIMDTVGLSQKAYQALEGLEYIDRDLSGLIHSKELLKEISSSQPSDPLPTMFEVRETMAAMAVCHHAIFSIIVRRILISLITTTPEETVQLESDIFRYSHRVWMLIEHSRLHKPLGLPAMQAALIFTFESAQDPKTKERILESLDDLDSLRMREGRMWKESEVLYAARSLMGSA
jgi:hypothetical protein